MKLKDMKYSKSQSKKMEAPAPVNLKEDYPYGLKLELDKDSMKKLGLDLSNINIKDNVDIVAKGHICDMSMHEGQYGGHKSLGIQITKLDVKPSKKSKANKTVSELKRFVKLSDK